MSEIVYSMNVSLDGFVAARDGSLDWAAVDDELHGWWNARVAEADAFLYGRRLYETMAAYWPTALDDPAATPVMREFARIWNARPKIVFSSTLGSVVPGCRLVREDIVTAMPAIRDEFPGTLDVGGPTLAAALIRRGLVDVYRPVVHPAAIGGGTPYLPAGADARLRLTDMHRFASGAVALAYVPA